MYEPRDAAPISRKRFVSRMIWHGAASSALLGVALAIGVVGYHYFGGLDWVDALLNASMILGGMGPVDALHSTQAKVFASLYALFSGLAFIGVTGLLLAPFIHRVLHKFHWEDADASD